MGKEVPPEKYQVKCIHCGRLFDACQSPWCECITENPTLVCPHCSNCFCNAGEEAINAFWEKAPPGLWRRRVRKHSKAMRVAPPMEEGNPLRRPLVLVAEDNDDTRLVAFRVLEQLGYGVLLARDGMEAFLLTELHNPDLILTDQVMPHMDGRTLSKLVKGNPRLAKIPVIIMTGVYKRERERIELLRESGADDYLLKPISYDKLGDVIAGWLG